MGVSISKICLGAEGVVGNSLLLYSGNRNKESLGDVAMGDGW